MASVKKLTLKTLRLQNFATFENQEIIFSDNFNAIIGETGSGKSLILDALQLILGARADKSFVRKGAEFASVEAIFAGADEESKAFFHEMGYPCEGDEIIVKRLIYSNEGSKSYLNFQACPLHALNGFAKRFIDLVGQFENQKLLSEDYQLVLLDHYCKHEKELEVYRKTFTKLKELETKIKSLRLSEEQKNQRLDYLKYQLDEISALNPTEEDEKNLVEKKAQITNWEGRKQRISELLHLISDNEEGNALKAISRALYYCERDKNLLKTETYERLHQAKQILEETSFELSNLLELGEDDLGELENIIDRLDRYQKLKKKFGVDTYQLLKIFTEFQDEYENLKSNEEILQKMILEQHKLVGDAKVLATKIHEKRALKAQELSRLLSEAVQGLRMKGATLDLRLSLVDELGPAGFTKVEFFAETNPGDGFFKVKEIASGGELSRILLALRQILSSHDSISIFLFDEIDTGIGGETALKIGEALKRVSTDSQVIAITHLPQIASFAEKLQHVDKKTFNDKAGVRTISFVQEIEGNEKENFVRAMTPILKGK